MNKQTPLAIWDSFDEILRGGEIDAIGFDFSHEPEGRRIATRAIESMGENLGWLNREWKSLLGHNQEKMVLWRTRLHVVRLAMQAVTASVDDRKQDLDWNDIARNLGFINAFRSAAEIAIGLYRAEREELDAIGR